MPKQHKRNQPHATKHKQRQYTQKLGKHGYEIQDLGEDGVPKIHRRNLPAPTTDFIDEVIGNLKTINRIFYEMSNTDMRNRHNIIDAFTFQNILRQWIRVYDNRDIIDITGRAYGDDELIGLLVDVAAFCYASMQKILGHSPMKIDSKEDIPNEPGSIIILLKPEHMEEFEEHLFDENPDGWVVTNRIKPSSGNKTNNEIQYITTLRREKLLLQYPQNFVTDYKNKTSQIIQRKTIELENYDSESSTENSENGSETEPIRYHLSSKEDKKVIANYPKDNYVSSTNNYPKDSKNTNDFDHDEDKTEEEYEIHRHVSLLSREDIDSICSSEEDLSIIYIQGRNPNKRQVEISQEIITKSSSENTTTSVPDTLDEISTLPSSEIISDESGKPSEEETSSTANQETQTETDEHQDKHNKKQLKEVQALNEAKSKTPSTLQLKMQNLFIGTDNTIHCKDIVTKNISPIQLNKILNIINNEDETETSTEGSLFISDVTEEKTTTEDPELSFLKDQNTSFQSLTTIKREEKSMEEIKHYPLEPMEMRSSVEEESREKKLQHPDHQVQEDPQHLEDSKKEDPQFLKQTNTENKDQVSQKIKNLPEETIQEVNSYSSKNSRKISKAAKDLKHKKEILNTTVIPKKKFNVKSKRYRRQRKDQSPITDDRWTFKKKHNDKSVSKEELDFRLLKPDKRNSDLNDRRFHLNNSEENNSTESEPSVNYVMSKFSVNEENNSINSESSAINQNTSVKVIRNSQLIKRDSDDKDLPLKQSGLNNCECSNVNTCTLDLEKFKVQKSYKFSAINAKDKVSKQLIIDMHNC